MVANFLFAAFRFSNCSTEKAEADGSSRPLDELRSATEAFPTRRRNW
ncbi:MAG: hypothetical protein IJE97_17090 [Thermoguttaceae bacterium]|nr:hypothetical protein [Thermoguttaceae bacterium]